MARSSLLSILIFVLVFVSSLATSAKTFQSGSKDESPNQSAELLAENGNANTLGRHRIDPRPERRSSYKKTDGANLHNDFLGNSNDKSLELPMKGSKSKKIFDSTYNRPGQETGNNEIDNHPNSFDTSDWKSLAISVFCNTPGDRVTKAEAVIDALEVAYPSYHWVVFVTEAENGWAYKYLGWESLAEQSLCGPMDLLVWGRTPGKGCYSSVESAASLLQNGAMTDAANLEGARDLMYSRESIYNLHYDLILTFYSGAWRDYLVQSCTNYESNINGMYSLWSGDLY